MTDTPNNLNSEIDQENLDPASWDEMRALGHRMIDDVVDYLADVRERPVWQPPSDSMRAFLDQHFKRHKAIASIITRKPPLFGSNHAPFLVV